MCRSGDKGHLFTPMYRETRGRIRSTGLEMSYILPPSGYCAFTRNGYQHHNHSGVTILPKHNQKVTVGVPDPCESAYRVDHDEVTDSGSLIGAGVLPFTVHPETGVIYFLLGKEHFVPGWRGSNCWSAFEGGVKAVDENVFCTAAREYMEESLGVLHPTCSKEDIERLAKQMQEGEDYALRVTLCIAGEMPRVPRFHVTFVRYFEWVDNITETFRRQRLHLIKLSKSFADADRESCSASLSEEDRTHAAIVTRGVGDGQRLEVAVDFLEKSDVRLFSAAEMADVVLSGSPKEYMFRSCFVRTMGVVLQEFNRRLSFSSTSCGNG